MTCVVLIVAVIMEVNMMALDDRIEQLKRFVEAAGDRDTFPRAVKQELKWLEELREWRKFGNEHGIYIEKDPYIERSKHNDEHKI